MTFPRGSTVLYNHEGLWVRVQVVYCSRKGCNIRIKWRDRAGQHIDEVGFTKLVPLEDL